MTSKPYSVLLERMLDAAMKLSPEDAALLGVHWERWARRQVWVCPSWADEIKPEVIQ